MEIMIGMVSALIGGGLLAFVQFLITRHDSRNDEFKQIIKVVNDFRDDMSERLDSLDRKIDSVEAKGDERNAVVSRVRILRFADEMQSDVSHSKDSWDQVMSDITEYNSYCETHEGFRNGQTAATVEYLIEQYKKRLEKHDFL